MRDIDLYITGIPLIDKISLKVVRKIYCDVYATHFVSPKVIGLNWDVFFTTWDK